MNTGIASAHTMLGYLLMFALLAEVLVAVMGAHKKPALAKSLKHVMNLTRGFGTFVLVLGAILLMTSVLPKTSIWAWSAVPLWGVVEFAGARLIKPQLGEGGGSAGPVIGGTVVRLLAVVAIIGIMTVKPFA
jgi:hypothetical protein